MMRFSVVSKSTLSSGAGTQGAEAGRLDGAEAVGLARPAHAVALLAHVDRLAERQLEAVEIELAALGAHLGEQAQQLLLPLLGDVEGAEVELVGLIGLGLIGHVGSFSRHTLLSPIPLSARLRIGLRGLLKAEVQPLQLVEAAADERGSGHVKQRNVVALAKRACVGHSVVAPGLEAFRNYLRRRVVRVVVTETYRLRERVVDVAPDVGIPELGGRLADESP